MKALLVCVALALAATACARRKEVTPAVQFQTSEICVIENADVDPVFLDTYVRALQAKGYSVQTLPPTAAVDACSVTSNYRAAWKKDVKVYLVFAEIRVYDKGVRIGRAAYDTKRSNLNLNKFKDAQETITGMVDELFPAKEGQ